MNIINNVPQNEDIFTDKKAFKFSWYTWFQQVYTICFAAQQSGTTAQRPDKLIWIGRRYFDSDLGKPVFVKSANPVVWVDGVGTIS